MDYDVVNDEYSSDDNDVSVSPVPIVPLLLPQPVSPLNEDNASTNRVGFITDDDDSNTLSPADIATPLENAPTELLLDFVAPDDDDSLENAPAELPLDFVAPDDASDAFVAEVVAPNDADGVFIDDANDASFDVSIDAPAPVAVDMIADEAAVEVTIDHIEPTNSYNLRSRSTPAFDSYSNPNNVNIHQQTQSTEQPYLHHQAKANN